MRRALPEVICNTSPLQYLHQIGQLQLLPALAGHITVPPAVLEELAAGQAQGLNLPDLSKVKPALDQLQALRFRLAANTRAAVLKLVGEL